MHKKGQGMLCQFVSAYMQVVQMYNNTYKLKIFFLSLSCKIRKYCSILIFFTAVLDI
jgi:uncharacterized membrane protein (UPF0127 family)